MGKSANPAAGRNGEGTNQDGKISSHAEPAWGNHEPEAGWGLQRVLVVATTTLGSRGWSSGL